jgi:hypothetical protein
MSRARAFAAFWWDFVVGDDWRLAAGLAVALALTALLVDEGLPAWWLMPVAVALALTASLRRATRGTSTQTALSDAKATGSQR